MKPFNLDAAKAGAPVITRRKYPATYIRTLKSGVAVFLVDLGSDGEDVLKYYPDGRFAAHTETCWDLFMAPETVEMWVNVYPSDTHPGEYAYAAHGTPERADESATKQRINGKAYRVAITLD